MHMMIMNECILPYPGPNTVAPLSGAEDPRLCCTMSPMIGRIIYAVAYANLIDFVVMQSFNS